MPPASLNADESGNANAQIKPPLCPESRRQIQFAKQPPLPSPTTRWKPILAVTCNGAQRPAANGVAAAQLEATRHIHEFIRKRRAATAGVSGG